MTDPYASVAEHYDIMIDWPARLARERPFFAELIAPGTRVLDVGCGTGQHCRLFAELGAQVTGLEPSTAMQARARALTAGDNPRFVTGGFAEIPALGQTFTLITVLGNTLAHVDDARGLAAALRAMRIALAPGGRLCIQVINYDSLLTVGSRRLPLIHRRRDEREYLFLREHRIIGRRAEFTITTLIRDGEWRQQDERSTHIPLTGERLQRALRRAGFHDISLHGSYQREPYHPAASPSLIVLATR